MKILLIEDNDSLRSPLGRSLLRRGFDVMDCGDGAEGLSLCRHHEFDAVVLDLGLPGMDGMQVLQRLRGAGNDVPVLILTARGSLGDRVVGLNAGADDYLAKPFELDELDARLRALVRRAGRSAQVVCGSLCFERDGGDITRDGRTLDLSPRERAMLQALMARPGHGVSRDRLHALVFGASVDVQHDALEVVVHRLRRKIVGSGAEIMTLRGVGYLLCEADPPKVLPQ